MNFSNTLVMLRSKTKTCKMNITNRINITLLNITEKHFSFSHHRLPINSRTMVSTIDLKMFAAIIKMHRHLRVKEQKLKARVQKTRERELKKRLKK